MNWIVKQLLHFWQQFKKKVDVRLSDNTHSGAKKIADTTLVAMTLMIAESNPKEMLMIVAMTINLISQ